MVWDLARGGIWAIEKCELDHFMILTSDVYTILSWDPTLNVQAVIKSAASAASRKNKIQESRGARGQCLGMRTAGAARLPWIHRFWSS